MWTKQSFQENGEKDCLGDVLGLMPLSYHHMQGFSSCKGKLGSENWVTGGALARFCLTPLACHASTGKILNSVISKPLKSLSKRCAQKSSRHSNAYWKKFRSGSSLYSASTVVNSLNIMCLFQEFWRFWSLGDRLSAPLGKLKCGCSLFPPLSAMLPWRKKCKKRSN